MKTIRDLLVTSATCLCLVTPSLAESWVQIENELGYRSGDTIVLNQPQPQPYSTVASVAKKFMGLPYVWAGTSPESGFDCSGFVYEVMRLNGYNVPRMADHQFEQSERVDKEELQLGDMVFFTTYLPGPSHVGIYIGNHEFVHASSAGEGVVVSQLETGYYADRFLGGGRPADWIGKRQVPESQHDVPLGIPTAPEAHVATLEVVEEVDTTAIAQNHSRRDPFDPADVHGAEPEADFEEPILNEPEETGKKLSLQFGELVAIGKLNLGKAVKQIVEVLDMNLARDTKENS